MWMFCCLNKPCAPPLPVIRASQPVNHAGPTVFLLAFFGPLGLGLGLPSRLCLRLLLARFVRCSGTPQLGKQNKQSAILLYYYGWNMYCPPVG